MSHQNLNQRLQNYLALIRFDRPIGTLLLLWPTLWALWLAADGIPEPKLLLIFILGTFLMRSAGCVINDYADRHIDGSVARTRLRPLATGAVSEKEALILFVVLCLLAFVLVLFTNRLTVFLSFGAVALATCYPFMKRYTHLPQVVLGAAFAFSVPMAFAAQSGAVPAAAWLVFTATLLWTVAYDTFYAMVDRDDDLKIGVKSTAILFGQHDRLITGLLQVVVLILLAVVGSVFQLKVGFYLALAGGAGLFVWQQLLIHHREKEPCFRAFLNNNRFGFVIFIGVLLGIHGPGL